MKNTPTAIQQLAETFGSLDEVVKQFDDMLYRLTWAYVGNRQQDCFLAQDYAFTEKLKEAIKADMLVLENPPQYAPVPPPVPLTPEEVAFRKIPDVPVVRSMERAMLIAEARGLKNCTPVKIKEEVCLLLNGCTEKELAVYEKAGVRFWGSFTPEGFMATNVHLM